MRLLHWSLGMWDHWVRLILKLASRWQSLRAHTVPERTAPCLLLHIPPSFTCNKYLILHGHRHAAAQLSCVSRHNHRTFDIDLMPLFGHSLSESTCKTILLTFQHSFRLTQIVRFKQTWNPKLENQTLLMRRAELWKDWPQMLWECEEIKQGTIYFLYILSCRLCICSAKYIH